MAIREAARSAAKELSHPNLKPEGVCVCVCVCVGGGGGGGGACECSGTNP